MSPKFFPTFHDPALLDVALTHASHAHEHQDSEDNERLELLGDAVLQLCITNWLLERFPDAREGQLSTLRQRLVNTKTLAQVATDLGIGARLKLGVGEQETGGRSRPRLLAGAVEAILGAVFLDAGYLPAEHAVRDWLKDEIDQLSLQTSSGWKDPRSQLQEWTQRKFGKTPVYEVLDEQGPAHNPVFEVIVRVDDAEFGRGRGRTKRDAAQHAALMALSQHRPGPGGTS